MLSRKLGRQAVLTSVVGSMRCRVDLRQPLAVMSCMTLRAVHGAFGLIVSFAP